MADPTTNDSEPVLSWSRTDPESRLGLAGARFTRVLAIPPLLLAGAATAAFYACLALFPKNFFAESFTQRGVVPYFIVCLTFWAVFLLFVKWLKLRVQARAVSVRILPADPLFVLSPTTVDDVLQSVYQAVDDPKQFVLFNRIVVALSNLRNIGRVADVDDILRTQAQQDESTLETSYALLNTFVWAIPVFGFIGTVLGLSQAIGGFGGVLSGAAEIGELKSQLVGVTAGLSTAFETTLQGLVSAVLIQFLITALRKSEEEFLDECSEYCTRNIVGRLRLTPFAPSEDPAAED